MKFACPHCGQHIEAGEDMGGAGVSCPSCSHKLTGPHPHSNFTPPTAPIIEEQVEAAPVKDQDLRPGSTSSPPNARPRQSQLAMFSLALGVVFLCLGYVNLRLLATDITVLVFFSLPPLILGIYALVVIGQSRRQLCGWGFAIAGICLTCFSFFFLKAESESYKKVKRTEYILCKLSIASRFYYEEYRVWPKPRSPADLIYIFNGCRNPATGQEVSRGKDQNRRCIAFMDFSLRDLAPASSSSDSAAPDMILVDPWGTAYAFCFDNGEAGYIEGAAWKDPVADDSMIHLPFQDVKQGNLHSGYAFFSKGPDRLTGTASTAKDDIRSW